jgi:DoxX-like family
MPKQKRHTPCNVGTKKGDSMKSPIGTPTSGVWMTRAGWILTGLSAAFMISDGVVKALFPPGAFLLAEIERLGESKEMVVPFAILYLLCSALYLIPRTVILGAILLTGYLGGAEAIQTRVSGSPAFIILLPVLLGAMVWGGVWLLDERLRNLIPLAGSRRLGAGTE